MQLPRIDGRRRFSHLELINIPLVACYWVVTNTVLKFDRDVGN